MPHIFISYATQDKDLADLLEADLGEKGHPVWRDMARNQDKSERNSRVQLALEDAYGILVIISKNTSIAEQTKDEIKLAYNENIPIIVLQMNTTEIPPSLKNAQVVQFLVSAVGQGIEQVRHYRNMLDSLVGILDKTRPITLYLEQLKATEDTLREAAAQALGDLGDPSATDALIQALTDPDADVRMFAAEALGKLRSEASLKPLMRILNDEDADVCAAAATALGQIGRSAAVGPIMEQLNHPDRFARAAAALALGELSSIDAVRSLTHMMRNDSISDVRSAATDALCVIRAITESPEADRALKRARIDWMTHKKE